MSVKIDFVTYKGWNNCIKLSVANTELIVTTEVGPRIIRYGFTNDINLLGENKEQLGGKNENEWMIRGGHRLWIAPEDKPRSYELDNVPIQFEEIENGIKTIQEPGNITGIQKTMEISATDDGQITINHILTNKGNQPFELSIWALTVMEKLGTAIVPLPKKRPHTESVIFNQEWSLWGYTHLGDPRLTFGDKYLQLRQDPTRPPNKLGIALREGWTAYQLDDKVFIKRFTRDDSKTYPDGNVNFEVFADEKILEIESLGPLTVLQPGESDEHTEIWSLKNNIPACVTETDIDTHILPLV